MKIRSTMLFSLAAFPVFFSSVHADPIVQTDVQVPLILQVTPAVSSGKAYITLQLKPVIGEFPVLLSEPRLQEVRVLTPEGETFMLSGLDIEPREQAAGSPVPSLPISSLKDIPVIGSLFRNPEGEAPRMIIFITAQIISSVE